MRRNSHFDSTCSLCTHISTFPELGTDDVFRCTLVDMDVKQKSRKCAHFAHYRGHTEGEPHRWPRADWGRPQEAAALPLIPYSGGAPFDAPIMKPGTSAKPGAPGAALAALGLKPFIFSCGCPETRLCMWEVCYCKRCGNTTCYCDRYANGMLVV